MRSKKFRFSIWVLLGVLSTSCYVTKQGYVFGKALLNREPIDDVLLDTKADPNVKTKLILVKKILEFAKDQKLNVGGAYRKILRKEYEPHSFLLSVAEAVELKPVTWWFPIVGNVPYLGYFEKEERDLKAKEWGAKGYDIELAEVVAFSTLGWFDDPVGESILKRSEDLLAEVILHELTHRTFWLPGNVTFNEELATFLSELMTIQYLKEKTQDEKLEARYKNRQIDRKTFNDWLKDLKEQLEEIYKNKNMDLDYKLSQKKAIITELTTTKKPKFLASDYVGTEPWNNARILGEGLYSPDWERWHGAYKCSNSTSAGDFLMKLKETSGKDSDPHSILDSLCLSKNKN